MLSGALRIRVQATWRKVRWCYDSGFQARRVLRDDNSATVPGTTSILPPIVSHCWFSSSFISLSIVFSIFFFASSFFVSSISFCFSFVSSFFLGNYGDDNGDGDSNDDDNDDNDNDNDNDNNDENCGDGSGSGSGDGNGNESTRRLLPRLCSDRRFHHCEVYR